MIKSVIKDNIYHLFLLIDKAKNKYMNNYNKNQESGPK